MRSTILSASRLLFVSIVLLVTSTPAYAQENNPPNTAGQESGEDDVVRVSTTLVTVPVSVMDRQGRFIPNLSRDQFRLYENGIQQEIAYFESADRPFTVALMLDTSDSTRFKLDEIQDAAIAFVTQLRANDRVIVAAFDRRVTILAEATSDRRVLDEAIRRTQTGGGTGLYNAVDVIINQRLSRVRGREAIVLFTDGVDTVSLGATYQSTLHAADELDTLVYAIQYNTYDDATKDGKPVPSTGQTSAQLLTANGERLSVAYARANRYLRLMSYRTGGRFYNADTVKQLTLVFTSIAQELRQQYSIGFYPASQRQGAEKRHLKVLVSMPHVVVQARRSYVFKPPAATIRLR